MAAGAPGGILVAASERSNRAIPRLWLGALPAVLVVYLAISLTYALRVPIGRSPDEFSHLNYAHLIADHAALPGASVLERQQPPLYYLLAAGLFRAGSPDVGARILSVALGTVTLLCIALAVRAALPRRPELAAGATALVALLPGFQFVTASVNDDSLALATGALLLLLTVRVIVAGPPTLRGLLVVGAALGVALLSKETDWAVAVVLLGAVAWRGGRALGWRQALAVVAPPLAIAGWWFGRNLSTFHRPLPPLQLAGEHPHLRQLNQIRGFVSATLRSLYGPQRYQGGLVTLPRPGTILIVVLVGSVLALLAAGAVLAARALPGWDRCQRAVALALGTAALLAGIFLVINSVALDLQPQGRYLLVAATGPALAAAWAASRLAAERRLLAGAAVITYAGMSIALSGLGLAAAISAAG